MPTYGYACKSCGNQFEVFQKITDASLTTCEQCGGVLKKILYPVGIQFKGSGFHVNDYSKSSASRDSASRDSGGETKSETKPETKTETKPETKTETKSETKTEAKPAATST